MTKVAIKGIAGRKLRTALTALAIVLGVAMVSGAYTLTDTMRGAADDLSQASYSGTDAVVGAKQAFETEGEDGFEAPTVPASVLQQVRDVPEVGVAVGDVTDDATKIIGRDGKPIGQGPYFGAGVDRTPGAGRLTPFKLKEGRWPSGPDQVVISTKTAADEGYRIGTSVQIATHGPKRRFTVVGLANFGEVEAIGTATFAIFELGRAQELFGKTGRFDSILVAGERGTGAEGVRDALAKALPEYRVQTAEADDRFTLDGLKKFIGILQKALLAFGGVAIFVGAFIIFNTLSITVAQRAREFGMLRTIGASRRQVLASVLTEALVIGAVASVIGLFAGLGLAALLDSIFRATGVDLPQNDLVFATRTVVVALLVGVVITVLAGLVPALRATRVAPVAVMREGAVLPESAIGRRAARIAIGTTIAGLALLGFALFGGGFAIGERLALMAPGVLILFVGVALLSPRLVRPMARVIGWPAERLGASAGRLARRNSMRNPGRTAVTAAALMIGVALVTFVAVFATGIKASTTTALERQVQADYVVNGRDGWSSIDPAAAAAVRGTPGVTAVTGITQDEGRAFGKEATVDGVDPAAIGRVFRFDWKDGGDESIAALASGGAIVGADYADEHGLKVGSPIEVTAASGQKLRLRVAGISDPPAFDVLSLGDVTVSKASYDKVFKTREDRFTFVSAGGASAGIEDALERRLAAFPDAKVQSASEFTQEQADSIDPLLALFTVLLGLAVVVSLFGIVNTLVLSVFERTRELGMLRAVGMTRRQVRRMVRHESVITALIGSTLGIGVGLLLAALATGALAEYELEFVVPVGQLVAFTVVAALAGVLAAILPASRASRLDPLKALQYE
ncbi:MAG TPA: FtsX-like permease family protein [Thermoleophilaceae bacterium]